MASMDKINGLLSKATDIEKKTFPKKNVEQRLRDYNYMNDPEFSEFQQIVDEEFIKANKLNVEDYVAKAISFLKKISRKLNEEECYEFNERMKKWYNKGGI